MADLIVNTRRLARNTDPETSHMAAQRVREFAVTHQGDILRILSLKGPMTVDQIANESGLPSQAVNKRLPEMQRLGLAMPINGMLRLSASGRMARVWSAA